MVSAKKGVHVGRTTTKEVLSLTSERLKNGVGGEKGRPSKLVKTLLIESSRVDNRRGER